MPLWSHVADLRATATAFAAAPTAQPAFQVGGGGGGQAVGGQAAARRSAHGGWAGPLPPAATGLPMLEAIPSMEDPLEWFLTTRPSLGAEALLPLGWA